MRTLTTVLAVVLLTSACTTTTSGTPPRSGVRVTCTSTGAKDIQDVRRVLSARADRLTKGRVTATASGSTVRVDIAGVTARRVHELCASGVLEFRPLVIPPATAPTVGVRGALAKLGFAVPTSEKAYDALTASRQKRLRAALGQDPCLPADAGDEPVVACGDALGTGKSFAALLGPPVVTGNQVEQATATAPNPKGQGGTAWTVTVTLDPAGRQAWTAYTTAHNVGNTATGPATTCGAATPCADWVGFVFDGTLLSLPVTQTAITGAATSVAGNFTEATAQRFAAALQAGQVPGRLKLVSVTPQ